VPLLVRPPGGVDGEVIETAENSLVTDDDVTCHAETNLVRQAWTGFDSKTLAEATLYSSTEPCAMCAYVLRETGVQSVIWGVDAGEVGGVRGRHRGLTDAEMSRWGDPPERRGGVLEMKCCRVLEE